MRRAIVALGVSAVLVGGAGVAAYAAGTAASGGMHDRMTTTDMKTMNMGSGNMGSMDMGSMRMNGTDMDAMHAQMRDSMPAEMAGACDARHMNN